MKKLVYHGKKTSYRISKTGEIYNEHGKKLRERYCPNGYVQACLRINKKYKYLYVHRAVYETYVAPIEEGLEINHIDGDKLNNSIENLEVVSSLNNKRHAWENDLSYSHNPHKSGNIEIHLDYPEKLVRKICKRLEEPEPTYADIASEFDVPISVIYGIANGKLWKNISKKYDIRGRFKRRSDMYLARDEKNMGIERERIYCKKN